MADRQGIEISTFLGGKLKETAANVTVVVDGAVHKVPFGRPFIATSRGVHSVAVYWGAQPKRARPATQVSVPAGGEVRLRWSGPRWIWQSGTLTLST